MHKIFLSLLLSVAAFTSTYAYDWLARIDDDRRVCRLSIPGTHDACTGYGFLPQDTLAGNYIARTQELNTSEQWAVGVRAFDLRPDVREEKPTKSSKKAKETKRTLQIYHASLPHSKPSTGCSTCCATRFKPTPPSLPSSSCSTNALPIATEAHGRRWSTTHWRRIAT